MASGMQLDRSHHSIDMCICVGLDGFAFIEFYEVSSAVDWMNKMKVYNGGAIDRDPGSYCDGACTL